MESQLQQVILEVLQDYADEVEQLLQASVRKKKLTATTDLLKSISTNVVNNGQDLASFELLFSTYGRYQDMKAVADHQPPVDHGKYNLLQWVEKQGVEKFKRVPGYLNSPPPDRRKAALRIAWAIAISIKKGGKKKHRRAWYAKTYWSTLNKLTENLLNALAEEQLRQLQNL